MTDPIAHSARETGAGVLELLRLFKNDQAAADRYASDCLGRAKAEIGRAHV
jgi:amidase